MKFTPHPLASTAMFVGCLILFSGFAGQSFAATELSIAPSLEYFKYVEYDIDGPHLDKESGLMPGAELNFTGTNSHGQYIKAGISLHSAKIEYNGQSQRVVNNVRIVSPLNTKTIETFKTAYLNLGVTAGTTQFPLDIHVLLAHTVWDRDIQPTATVGGTLEVYEWSKIGIGLKQALMVQTNNQLSFAAELFRTHSPFMTVDFSSYGDRKRRFELGTQPGYRLMLDYVHKINDKTRYGLSLFYEYYSFGKSDSQLINLGPITGNTAVPFNEPDSDTKQIGLQLTISSKL